MLQLFQQASPASGPAGLVQYTPLIVMAAIFYFLVFMPMKKRQKATQQMIASLKKGDEVITSGGIFGRITAIDEERGTLVLQISDNTKIKVLRSGIAGPAANPEAVASSASKQ
jgi:preprotein translocase subunit YajC